MGDRSRIHARLFSELRNSQVQNSRWHERLVVKGHLWTRLGFVEVKYDAIENLFGDDDLKRMSADEMMIVFWG